MGKATAKPTGYNPAPVPGGDDPRQPLHTDDLVMQFARAISIAEGFQSSKGEYFTRNRSYIQKNPGSIFQNGVLGTYPTFRAGWDALHRLVSERIIAGRGYFNTGFTLQEVARVYVVGPYGNAADPEVTNWARNVAAVLGVSPTTTIRDLKLYIV